LKKLITILSLLLIILVQFGSVGFTYYRNDCSTSKSSTFTYNNEGCTCKKNVSSSADSKSCCEKTKSEKSCCQRKKSSYCSSKSDDNLRVKKKCCSSTTLFFKVLSEPFNTSAEHFQLVSNHLIIPTHYDFKIEQATIITNVASQGYYKCNSPPIRNYQTRIFIQSFQI